MTDSAADRARIRAEQLERDGLPDQPVLKRHQHNSGRTGHLYKPLTTRMRGNRMVRKHDELEDTS